MNTKPAHFAESTGQWPEAGRHIKDVLEYVRQMRLFICQEAGSARSPRTFAYWKRLFEAELARVRQQERMRMALSRDWSGLGRYVEDSLLIRQYSIALGTAGLLSLLRFPGACRLFETSVAVMLRTVLPERLS